MNALPLVICVIEKPWKLVHQGRVLPEQLPVKGKIYRVKDQRFLSNANTKVFCWLELEEFPGVLFADHCFRVVEETELERMYRIVATKILSR